jgi:prolyl-tRNA synthetase
MLDLYADFSEKEAGVPVLRGRKSASEKFAGAEYSCSIEAMMGDRSALQAGTSHNLGRNFARAFDIQYLDRNNERWYCWATSWGQSSCFIGAIIMVHGDDQGLILPPRLAPHQAVIVPMYRDEGERSEVMQVVERLEKALTAFCLHVDRREGQTPGGVAIPTGKRQSRRPPEPRRAAFAWISPLARGGASTVVGRLPSGPSSAGHTSPQVADAARAGRNGGIQVSLRAQDDS